MMRSIVFLFYALLACDDFRHCHQGLTPAEARGREARPAPKFCWLRIPSTACHPCSGLADLRLGVVSVGRRIHVF